MALKRIYQVAKELNISHLEILDFLKSKDVSVANHMAPVDSDIYNMILVEFSKEKADVERVRKEKARKEIIKTKDILQAKPEEKSKFEDNKKELDLLKKKDENPVEEEKNPKDTSKNIDKEKTDDNLEEKDLKNKKDVVSEQKKEENKAPKLKKIDLSAITDKINNKNKFKNVSSRASVSTAITNIKKKSKKKSKKKRDQIEEVVSDLKVLKVPEFTSVDELAQSMKVSAQEVIMKCIGMGLMVTINQRLDMDTMIMVTDEFGFEIEALDIYKDTNQETDEEDLGELVSRPSVVTIMGHVDHGKTSLLDYIRNTNVIAGESGGITQHIGAYKVNHDGKDITFIDTPGHAAFTAMRARGAQVTDIVVVIVAADDSIMPQTIEAIDHAKAANVPIIIAINKIDLPGANIDKVKKELSEKGILVEDWGGKYQCAEISAKKGTGVDSLIEKILIESDMLELKASLSCAAKGIVVESKLDKGLGPIATILVQHGELKKGDIFVCGSQYSRIRELLNERNEKMEVAHPSDPVQILGFSKVPNAGDIITIYESEREAKKISLERSQIEREAEQQRYDKLTLEQIGKQIKSGSVADLNIIIKGDVDGSIEALSDSLMGLSNDEVNIKIILKSVGMVSQNDVNLASTANAVIVAFNSIASVNSKKLATSLGVEIRHYSIIYNAIEDMKLALEGMLEPDIIENPIGKAEVRDKFKIPKIGIIAGCSVTEGKVIKNSLLRLLREGESIYEGKLTSLKRFKDDVNEVNFGYECGIGIEGFYEFLENDIIEVYELKEVKRTLK